VTVSSVIAVSNTPASTAQACANHLSTIMFV
jgi:hypothetical protein